jgi:formylglycine-generating enzyme required for sulfatase activity
MAALLFMCPRAAAVTIVTVPVGNRGNAGDLQSQGTFGAVAYNYRIGKYEVTNAEYTEFLNAKAASDPLALYKPAMGSSTRGGITKSGSGTILDPYVYAVKPNMGNNPVTFVSWYDAVRFANWLHNGQGGGDTETGAYTLLGGTPTPSNGQSITRNAGATWFLTSEDEWYKAAYHNNDGATGNYWRYPTSTDVAPYSDQPPGTDAPTPSNTANFFLNDGQANGYNDGYAVTGSTTIPSGNTLTDVGAYTHSTSPYGTFDQGGNVWEWNEAAVTAPDRSVRGGSYGSHSSEELRASSRSSERATFEGDFVGFRMATVPEPSTLALGLLAALGGYFVARKGRRT